MSLFIFSVPSRSLWLLSPKPPLCFMRQNVNISLLFYPPTPVNASVSFVSRICDTQWIVWKSSFLPIHAMTNNFTVVNCEFSCGKSVERLRKILERKVLSLSENLQDENWENSLWKCFIPFRDFKDSGWEFHTPTLGLNCFHQLVDDY